MEPIGVILVGLALYGLAVLVSAWLWWPRSR
jgi:hypothetical protein